MSLIPLNKIRSSMTFNAKAMKTMLKLLPNKSKMSKNSLTGSKIKRFQTKLWSINTMISVATRLSNSLNTFVTHTTLWTSSLSWDKLSLTTPLLKWKLFQWSWKDTTCTIFIWLKTKLLSQCFSNWLLLSSKSILLFTTSISVTHLRAVSTAELPMKLALDMLTMTRMIWNSMNSRMALERALKLSRKNYSKSLIFWKKISRTISINAFKIKSVSLVRLLTTLLSWNMKTSNSERNLLFKSPYTTSWSPN